MKWGIQTHRIMRHRTVTSQESDVEEDSQDDESLRFEDADTDIELIEPSTDIEADV